MAVCLPTVLTARRLPTQKSTQRSAIKPKSRLKRKRNLSSRRRPPMKCKISLLVSLLLLAALAPVSRGAATIIIQNNNGAGVGFNDPTPVAPIGGNAGTTLGAQRLNAFQHAASIWGATLTSSIPIVIRAQFSALTCTATTATLGSAGATMVFSNFPGAIQTNTWYS